jgi:hypothetical protein
MLFFFLSITYIIMFCSVVIYSWYFVQSWKVLRSKIDKKNRTLKEILDLFLLKIFQWNSN